MIAERGGDFQYSDVGWDGYTIADDRLITGQDPSSAAKVALLVIEKLQSINDNRYPVNKS